ncbi:hypothetical protein ACF061_37075 [Streptomyces sp. NPDC015220]|uniref:hypothetical protein n=1 Tax=Streptomyces sp. NPDC015220 TaxID=3364947 RepID=UPI0036FFE1E8
MLIHAPLPGRIRGADPGDHLRDCSKDGASAFLVLPAVVQEKAATASFDFTAGRLVTTAPRWTVATVRLPVSWDVDGSVTCHRPGGDSWGRSGSLGGIEPDETNTSVETPADCTSVELDADVKAYYPGRKSPFTHLVQTFTAPSSAR